MSSRAAHVLYDEEPNSTVTQLAAKHELTQQIFTKTMVTNIWKPEHERPGRHFVYTTRYTQFFMRILVQLNERSNLEQLAKRVRKKPQDYYNHQALWHELVVAYTKILRKAGGVPEGHEEAIFKNLSWDEWSPNSTRLEAWCQSPTFQSPLLEVLRDVVELKKVNNGLTKNTLIDDLLGDTFALMYQTILPKLPPDPPPAPAPTPQVNAMSVSNLMNVDGAADTPAQPADQATPQPTRPRQKGVGRRELQKRAEAAVSKPVQPLAPAKPTTTTPQTSAVPSLSNPEVVVEIRSPRPKIATQSEVQNSVPPSVHDSADDESESELSEPADDEEQEQEQEQDQDQDPDQDHGEPESDAGSTVAKPIFPGLADAKATAAESTEASGPGTPAAGDTAQE